MPFKNQKLPIRLTGMTMLLLAIMSACSPGLQSRAPLQTNPARWTHSPEALHAISTNTPAVTQLPFTPTTTPTQPRSTATRLPPRTPSPTPTPQPPTAMVMQDTTCLFGPHPVYGVRTYLTSGETPTLIGVTSEGEWFAVEINQLATTCWVSASVLDLSGSVDLLPIFTPQPTPSPEPSPTERLRGLKYYLIALGAGGPFGCGDGLVYFYSGKPETGNLEADIKSALNSLFKLKTKDVSGYYNPVYNAHLHVTRVTLDHATGRAEIYLEGAIPKPPDVCESKRIHDAVWGTAEQFQGISDARIWVGPHLLGDLIAVGDR